MKTCLYMVLCWVITVATSSELLTFLFGTKQIKYYRVSVVSVSKSPTSVPHHHHKKP